MPRDPQVARMPNDYTISRRIFPNSAVHRIVALLVLHAGGGEVAHAQARQAAVIGVIRDAANGQPVVGALVIAEGAYDRRSARSDSAGSYRLAGVATGPTVLLARRIGYAPSRVPVTVPTTGEIRQDIVLAMSALELPRTIVTADATSRARGELGTASVIGREAIANQTAASLAGVLELVPGTVLAPPGLGGVQQFSVRSAPASTDVVVPGSSSSPSAAALASAGTLIVLDGVPLSNNANLQSAGPRAELTVATSAGGGVDLRRIPASTLEHVEVIRGVPSARYGDLTSGVVVVDTRAGAVPPAIQARLDARTSEVSTIGGWAFGRDDATEQRAATASLNLARTRLAPGVRDDEATRVATQLAFRTVFGGRLPGTSEARGGLDLRLDGYRLEQNSPEQPDVQPGRTTSARDAGGRLSARARLTSDGGTRAELTLSADRSAQRASAQTLTVRPALPFTDRLEPGRATGRFIGGQFLAGYTLEGQPWLLYSRAELARPAQRFARADHRLRAGAEVRREGNSGAGYQFDIAAPPQVSFNGVQGFDRPRRFDAVPAVATTALYLDDRFVAALPKGAALDVQAGVRLDVLHDGSTPFSAARSAVVQPRLNVEIAPRSWVRLRGSAGTTTKAPSVLSLYPAPQYFDVVNVNYFANDPAERLAVLTTFVRDPSNDGLGFSRTRRLEAGLELSVPRQQAALSLVAFDDRTRGAVGLDQQVESILRERFDFVDSTQGTGRPPVIVEPASRADTVPILIDQPANNLTLSSRGVEATLALPEIPYLHTRVEMQGALVRTRLEDRGFDFGRLFSSFQLDQRVPRAPYFLDAVRTGERALVTTRIIHQQPELGLIVTAVVQHTLRDRQQDEAATDSLAFAGYVTRGGALVPVPAESRTDPEFDDLRVPRGGQFSRSNGPRPDWLMNLQVSKTLPRGGRLSFFAFNVLDRRGRFGGSGYDPRPYPGLRFGVDLSMPLVTRYGGAQ